MSEIPDIPGAQDVVDWFGYWPSFHDAEVLSISFDRLSGCRASIHAFETTSELDRAGHYVVTKHVVIVFFMEGFTSDSEGVSNTRIESFNHQNVLRGASIIRRPEGYELSLQGCYGVDGSILCERMSVAIEPGVPTGSVYRK